MTAATRPWGRLWISVILGYIAALAVTSAFTALLPIHRKEAVNLGLVLMGLVYTLIFIYVFSVPTWLRALRDVFLLTLVSAVILVLNKMVFA
ncbi:MAG: hypothetical protein AAGB16_05470 [Pseudomonadota bacterium]